MKTEYAESIEITFKPKEEEHLREVYVVREAKNEEEAVTSQDSTEVFHSDSTSQMENTEHSTSPPQEVVEVAEKAKTQASGNGGHSDTEEGFVVYAKHGEDDLVEIDKKV